VADDFSEVRALAHDIGKISGKVFPEVRAAVVKAAVNVKKDTRERISDHPTWKRLERTVGYDMHGLAADIGYEDTGQGELAGIHEFGSAKRAPHPALIPAANAEEPRFLKALGDVKGWDL
jgi:hypothetical protein